MELSVETIVLTNSEKRGIQELAKQMNGHYIQDAARELYDLEKGIVFILTGFYVNGAAETDGPPGAYFLGNALKKLGYEVYVITDRYCEGYFDYDIPGSLPARGISLKHEEAKREMNELVRELKPDVVISIERCGRNIDGDYCNMRGVSIKEHTAPLDHILEILPEDVLTIGIGDGGNEIGMGKMSDIISRKLKSIIPCIVPTKHLLLAAVSNWAAYGMIAYLSRCLNEDLMADFEHVEGYICYINSLGAVDGVTGLVSPSVDGYSMDEIREIYERLRQAY